MVRSAVAPVPVPTVLLIGNPNVGKSLLFKNLTHRYVNVSNFPGTTVEITRARASCSGGNSLPRSRRSPRTAS